MSGKITSPEDLYDLRK